MKINIINLDISYRSSQNIIDFINHIFHNKFQEAFDNSYIKHKTVKDYDSGEVEIWPLITTNSKTTYKSWEINDDQIINKSINSY